MPFRNRPNSLELLPPIREIVWAGRDSKLLQAVEEE